MNFSSIISKVKSYPLLFAVIIASVRLAAVFFIQKNNNNESNPASEISTSAEEQNQLLQPATFATDSNGNKIVSATDAVPSDAEQSSQNGTDTTENSGIVFSTETTDPTEPTTDSEPASGPAFTTVDDDYFNDALFIGNSRTVGLSLYGSMPEEATFYATVGMNIYDLMTSSAQIPPEEGPEQSFKSLLSSKQFGKIYIMLGINDLGTGTSESFAEYYKGIIEQIHAAQPNAIIYVQSIINISAERDAQGDAISNSNINEKNALLKQLANNDYIYYLNINEVLIDSNGFLNSDYTSDGIHLGGGSLSLWEDYLYSHAIVK